MKIRTKLTLQFLVAVGLILLLSFVAIYWSSVNYREDEFYSRLEKKALTTAEIRFTMKQVDSTLQKLIDQKQKDVFIDENIVVYDDSNKVIYTNNDTVYFKTEVQYIPKIYKTKYVKFTEGEYEILGLLYNNSVVFAGAIDKYGKSKLANLRNTLIILYIFIAGIIALVGWFFAGQALEPITEVVDEVNKISPNNLKIRLSEFKNQDEIGQLISTFNNLLDRIEQSFNLQKMFLAGASHELKNPLTVITSQLQVSLLQNRENEEYRKTLISVLDDIKDLNQLTHQLIELAKLSQNIENIPLNKVQIDDVIYQSKQYIESKYKNYSVEIDIKSLPSNQEKLFLNGNEALLKLAFINLIENACKYSFNKTCTIEIAVSDYLIKILFINTGKLVNDNEIDLLFEPFYRTMQSSHIKGNGIGLALVKEVVSFHKGKVEFVKHPVNTIFRLYFSN
ncbi:MAG: hypothetical protein RLZZ175_2376 [Bacteroidota bacterium]|jgi:signal transduction histidine kinase